MPHITRAVPAAVPQSYFGFTPSALVLSQETKSHAATTERLRVPREKRESSHWHRTRHHYESHTEPASEPETSFRHGGWLSARSAIREAFKRCNLPALRLDRFEQCGSGCYVQREVGGNRFRLAGNYCHDRFCLPCARARSRVIGDNLRRLCGDEPAAHLVLTLRHSVDPLAVQLDRLIKGFAALRRHKLWGRSVKGGAYFFEVKVAKDGVRFHPHLHVIVSGSYIDQGSLSLAWLSVTKDSDYVYIKAIDRNQKVLAYAAKYASKSYDVSVVRSPRHLDECLLALRGRRLCSTFGTWRGRELEDEADDPGVWVTVGRLDSIIRDARGGSVGARGLLYMVAPKWAESHFPLTPGADPPALPQAS